MRWRFDRSKMTALRALKDLSTRDLAQAIGKTEESVRLKEKGKSPFTVDELCAIGTAFDIDPRSFLVPVKKDAVEPISI